MPRTHFAEAQAAAQQVMTRLRPHEHEDMMRRAEESVVRRDMVTLLTYVHENRVVGTQSTGNLPLKAMNEITARFVHPLKLEETIGGHTYRARSEEEVWPLHYLHILAEVGGLVDTGRARQWRLKRQGDKFLATDPFSQVAFLLSTWWHRVNWLVAYPYGGMGDSLPPDLPSLTLKRLRTLPVKKRIGFKKFANQLISAAVLTWTAQDTSMADFLLRGAVERMILDILSGFGAATLEHRNKPLGKGTIPELVAFRITPLGEQLLKVLAT
jgi:hypothetical protein